ncbi:hypothetical protein XELAEV_18044219mg [Xenopus laevis]|uniref:Uncharacterized protein n=1 Tax=Xenopus laevis TaxID=8355 RepID=A0A974H328_XENLA|nr:hypothetical protein XELAEV_18044219mg [Xenopus laevis]
MGKQSSREQSHNQNLPTSQWLSYLHTISPSSDIHPYVIDALVTGCKLLLEPFPKKRNCHYLLQVFNEEDAGYLFILEVSVFTK